jgi:hypothetical protein
MVNERARLYSVGFVCRFRSSGAASNQRSVAFETDHFPVIHAEINLSVVDAG